MLTPYCQLSSGEGHTHSREAGRRKERDVGAVWPGVCSDGAADRDRLALTTAAGLSPPDDFEQTCWYERKVQVSDKVSNKGADFKFTSLTCCCSCVNDFTIFYVCTLEQKDDVIPVMSDLQMSISKACIPHYFIFHKEFASFKCYHVE